MPKLPKAAFVVLSAVAVVAIAALALFAVMPKRTPTLAVPIAVPENPKYEDKTFSDAHLGLRFEYGGGMEGYKLVVADPNPEADGGVANLLFYRTKSFGAVRDYRLLSISPTMTIAVYPAPGIKDAKQWMEYHSEQLSFAPEGGARPTIAESTVGGANATAWATTDSHGAPAARGTLVLADGRAYLVQALFLGDQPTTGADYDALLASMTFPPTGLLAADSPTPAAPVCPESEDATVVVTLHPDVPQPRCAKVKTGQALQVRNETKRDVDVWLGPAKGDAVSDKITVKAGESGTLETLPADVLDYGVSHLRTSRYAGPALWVVPESEAVSEMVQ